MEQANQSDRFSTVVAVLLALVTVMGAIVAWRAAIAADNSGDADFAGIAATLNAEEARALNQITAYEHLRAYAEYVRYNEIGNQLNSEWLAADDADAPALERQMRENWDLATELQESFFENRYVREDGTYDLARQLDELWADDLLDKDAVPDPHFSLSDALRQRSITLVALLIPLGLALLFFTLAGTIKNRLRYLLAVAGVLILIGSAVALAAIEMA